MKWLYYNPTAALAQTNAAPLPPFSPPRPVLVGEERGLVLWRMASKGQDGLPSLLGERPLSCTPWRLHRAARAVGGSGDWVASLAIKIN